MLFTDKQDQNQEYKVHLEDLTNHLQDFIKEEDKVYLKLECLIDSMPYQDLQTDMIKDLDLLSEEAKINQIHQEVSLQETL